MQSISNLEKILNSSRKVQKFLIITEGNVFLRNVKICGIEFES